LSKICQTIFKFFGKGSDEDEDEVEEEEWWLLDQVVTSSQLVIIKYLSIRMAAVKNH
jgi:hypothetical protein